MGTGREVRGSTETPRQATSTGTGLPPGKRTLVAAIQPPPPPQATSKQAGSRVGQAAGASPAGVAHRDGFPAERGFSKVTQEKIENAPAGSEAWNGEYEWDSKMHLALEPDHLQVTVRIFTSATEANRAQWAKAITDKWSGRMDLHVLRGAHPGYYPILVGVDWVAREADADYTVTPNAPGATADGRQGQGGTISMTGWGTNDSVDVTHEFGHMLGNAEEYFTTNGVDYTQGGKKAGFRDPGAGVMNNPAEAPFERHYDLIRQNAAEMLGLPADTCSVVPHREVGDFPVPSKDTNEAFA